MILRIIAGMCIKVLTIKTKKSEMPFPYPEYGPSNGEEIHIARMTKPLKSACKHSYPTKLVAYVNRLSFTTL